MKTPRPLPLQTYPSIALIAACSALAACQPSDDTAGEENAANEVGFNLPSVPLPKPPIGRADLLAAVAQAASAEAAGADDSAAQRLLDGQQFELRIRFGCRGPAPELDEAVLGWSFDAGKRTLRVRAAPTISIDDAIAQQILQQVNGERFEAVEGFWIPRPWLLDPVCPDAPPAAPAGARAGPLAEALARASRQPEEPATQEPSKPPVEDVQESVAPPPAWPKVGIARFYTGSDPRTQRRDMRPYETVKTLREGQAADPQGFNLVLSGRLQALPGQKVIACVGRGADNPPECIISADFHRVWIERPENRQILAEWGSG